MTTIKANVQRGYRYLWSYKGDPRDGIVPCFIHDRKTECTEKGTTPAFESYHEQTMGATGRCHPALYYMDLVKGLKGTSTDRISLGQRANLVPMDNAIDVGTTTAGATRSRRILTILD